MNLKEFRDRVKNVAGADAPFRPLPNRAPSRAQQQKIYEAALTRPRQGYKKHPLFRRAPFTCPLCGGWPWVRVRAHTDSAIGCICPDCGWASTYTNKPALPRPPHQPDLPK